MALAETSSIEQADGVLTEAVRMAEAAGDQRQAALAELVRLQLRPSLSPEGWADEAERDARRAMEVFTRLGDHHGLARGWAVLAEVHYLKCRIAASERAHERAIDHARQAGDTRAEAEYQAVLAGSGLNGPTPVDAAVVRCEHVLAGFPGNRGVRARVLRVLSGLKAMLGHFDEARSTIADSRAVFADLGQAVWLASSSDVAGMIEWLAGDLPAAEAALRHGCGELERMGERAYLSTVAGMLAQVLAEQGLDEEALRFSVLSETTAASDDVDPQVRWRSARARVLARRGEGEGAHRLARNAVELAAGTDALDLHGDALANLAEVLRLSECAGDAETAFGRARQLYERKGNVVAAKRMDAVLTRLRT